MLPLGVGYGLAAAYEGDGAAAAEGAFAATIGPIVGAGSAIGQIVIGAARTPTALCDEAKLVRDGQTNPYTGKARDLVGHTISARRARFRGFVPAERMAEGQVPRPW